MQGAVIMTYKWAKATANSRKGNIVTKCFLFSKLKHLLLIKNFGLVLLKIESRQNLIMQYTGKTY